MKTLKKTLCLVLAVVMSLSLVTVAGAEFDDVEADNDYAEAIEVMSAINVLNGVGGGNFKPEGTLTRAQGAKIITYMLLGKTAADALPGEAVAFSDVAKSHWAAGSIAYCNQNGIVDGVGGGRFSPESSLTGYAFGKMVLTALGVKGDFTGTGWELNVAVALREAKLLDNLANLTSAPLTRGMAAQLAFNGIQYSPAGSTTVYTVNKDDKTYEFSTAADAYFFAGNDGEIGLKTTYPGSLAETVFGNLKSDTDKADDFGRPTTVWTNDGGVKVDVTDEPDFTFDTAMTEKEVFAAVGDAGIQGSSDKYIVMDKIYIDGDLKAAAKGVNGYAGQYEAASGDEYDAAEGGIKESVIIAKNSTSNLAGFGNGVTVELYKVSANHYVLVAVNEWLATVGKPVAANDKTGTGRTIPLTFTHNNPKNKVDDAKFETDDFAQNDIVLVTVAQGEVASVKLAPVTTGVTVKSYTDTSFTTNDGTTYAYSQNFEGTKPDSFTAEYNVYTDSKGNAIKVVAATDGAEANDYVYVISYQTQGKTPSLTDLFGNVQTEDTDYRALAEVIFPDGTHEIVDLTVNASDGKFMAPKNGGSSYDGAVEQKTAGDGGTTTKQAVGNWYAYIKVGDTYTLSRIVETKAKAQSSDVTLTAGTPKNIESSYYTTSKTEVVIIAKDTYAHSSATGLVGATLKSSSGDKNNVLVVLDDASKTVTAIYAVNQENSTFTATGSVFAYAISKGETTSNGTSWTFAINGTQETYVISGTSQPAVGQAYKLSESSAVPGTYTVVGSGLEITTGNNKKVVQIADSSYILIQSQTNFITLNSATKVYDLRTGSEIGSEATVKAGDTVVIIGTDDQIKDGTSEATANIIYIVDSAS